MLLDATSKDQPNKSMISNELMLLEAAQKILLAMEVGEKPQLSEKNLYVLPNTDSKQWWHVTR